MSEEEDMLAEGLEEETKTQLVREYYELCRIGGCGCNAFSEQELASYSVRELRKMVTELAKGEMKFGEVYDTVSMNPLTYKDRIRIKIETEAPLRGKYMCQE